MLELNNEQPEKNSAAEKPKRKTTRRRTPATNTKAVGQNSRTEINQALATIYQDAGGNIPDMKKITVRKKNPLAGAFSWLLLLASLGALFVWAGFLFWKPTTSGNPAELSIAGPTEIEQGATSTYTIAYANNYSTALKNVTLNIYYPAGFIFMTSSPKASNLGHTEWQLGNLAAGASGALTVVGKNYGALQEEKSWRASLNYTPTNFNSELQKIAILKTTIETAPLTLAITGPDKVTLGSPATFLFTVTADTGWTLPVELAPLLPKNFSIASSSPTLDKNNKWTVVFATSSIASPKIFSIIGSFTDLAETAGAVQGALFLPIAGGQRYNIASATITPELVKNNINFDLAINGSLHDFDSTPGDMLNMTLRLKNTSKDTIKNAMIKLVLQAPSLKRQSLLGWLAVQDKFDGTIVGEQLSDTVRQGTITWDAKKIPALNKLKPNDEVEINVQLPIKDAQNFDFSSLAGSSNIHASADLDFIDQNGAGRNLSAGPITIALNTNVKFENRDAIKTNDQGKETHAVTWILTNTFHALKDISITANVFGDTSYLPDGAAAGTINYDDAAKKITWKITEMPESADILNGSFLLIINKNNPSQSLLLSKPHLTATDTVTGKSIDLAGDEITLNKNP